MQVCTTIAALREARAAFPTLGLVPTMGALHEGHLSLVRRAKAENGAVAVSIFVNPAQFGPDEDFSRYPRTPERDLALLEAAGTDLAFTPEVTEIYPEGFSTHIEVGPLGDVLEGAIRPGHFNGVATVVTKLLNAAGPDRAYFGQKDAQQCAVIRRVAADLALPAQIVVAPIFREADGLAMSSRNAYLDAPRRAAAPVLHRALQAAQAAFAGGRHDAESLKQAMRAVLDAEPLAVPDYVTVVDPSTMREIGTAAPGDMALLAVRIGPVRLLDNALLK